MKKIVLFVLMLAAVGQVYAQSEFKLRLYPQIAFGARNDLKCPNDGVGTMLSLPGDLQRNNAAVLSPRIEFEYVFRRHHFMLTGVFVSEGFSGTAPSELRFCDAVFDAGTMVNADYRFNTYRFTYRYGLVKRPKFAFEIGATLLVRDARIAMNGVSGSDSFSNLGVVPLVSYRIAWMPMPQLSVYSEGDALASKYGRAEDIFAGVKYDVSPHIGVIAGYRLLEGGSDVASVYTFAMYHFISWGLEVTF